MSSLAFHLDSSRSNACLVFPESLRSTNVEEIQREAQRHLEQAFPGSSSVGELTIDLSQTRLVDSLGLNLLFGLIQFAKKRKGTVKALVKHLPVRLLFRTVRLDRHITVSDLSG